MPAQRMDPRIVPIQRHVVNSLGGARGGPLFTAALIVAGVASVAYLFSAISQKFVSGELRGTLRRRRMQQDKAGTNGSPENVTPI